MSKNIDKTHKDDHGFGGGNNRTTEFDHSKSDVPYTQLIDEDEEGKKDKKAKKNK